MELEGRGTDFWQNLKQSVIMLPYVRQELDRKYNWNSKIRKLKENDPDLLESLTGRVCVMTGGTRGIGAEVVKVLLKKGCHVITGSSSKNTLDHLTAYKAIRAEVPEEKGKLEIWQIDLKSMDSVIEFTEKLNSTKLCVNFFIANAGISYHELKLTKDNFEQTLAVNYLSHCLLIDRLIDNMYQTSKRSNTESRIVLVSSCYHKGMTIRFDDLMFQKSRTSRVLAYSQSKLALVMFASRMDRWLKDKGEDWSKGITINSLHPGLTNTQLLSHMPLIEELRTMAALALRSSKEGAETTIYATISSQMSGVSGKYLEDSTIEEPSIQAQNKEDQNKLWQITWNLLEKWTEHNWV